MAHILNRHPTCSLRDLINKYKASSSQNFKKSKIPYTTLYISLPPCYPYTMNKNEPQITRTVKLRIQCQDPDGKTMNAKYELPEDQLTDINIDPREVLFQALQQMAVKLVEDAFPTHTLIAGDK